MLNISPIVTVVMSVYNGASFLKESVMSILNQSFKDFEFIIINDGSTDNSLDILNEFQDTRIKIIDNVKNKGLIYSLNLGLKEAKGDYIVRMDADDISLPTRIEKQVFFMQKHPEVGICGSYIESFGENIKKKVLKYPLNYEMNEAQLLFSPCVGHPSVIMRQSIISKFNLYYESQYKNVEDYAYWIKALKYTKISNIPQVLLKYRVLSTSITQQAERDFEIRFSVHKSIYLSYFRYLNYTPNDDELLLHFIIADNHRFIKYGKDISPVTISSYLNTLYSLAEKSELIDSTCLSYHISKRGFSISRWYSKDKLDIFSYMTKFLYYKVKKTIHDNIFYCNFFSLFF
jgi:glycosyltransferase involved in cell wall biosynthesis